MSENKILKKQTLPPNLHFVQEMAAKNDESVDTELIKKSEVLELDLGAIDLDNTQFEYRLDPGIELLMESIRKDGQQIPVILRGDKPPYQLICGFRRVRSIKALGGGIVKAIVVKEIDDSVAHRLSVLENEERKSLTDLDRATACQKLYKEGRTQEEVAEILRCSRNKVIRYLSLLKVAPAIFEALRLGRIPTMHALLLEQAAGIFNSTQIAEFIEQVANKELSVRELERKIKRVANKDDKPARKVELFKQTNAGFKLAGFSYRKDMPRDEKKRVITALKKALELLTGKEGENG